MQVSEKLMPARFAFFTQRQINAAQQVALETPLA
jgi:hypothetical protein